MIEPFAGFVGGTYGVWRPIVGGDYRGAWIADACEDRATYRQGSVTFGKGDRYAR